MKMTRRDFLNVSTAAAVVCAATLLPVEKAPAAQLCAEQHNKRWRRRNFWNRRICTPFRW